MKLTNVKAMVAKMFTVSLLAGAVVLAAPTKAQAQVRVGVVIAPPVRFGPVYAAPVFGGYYGRPVYGPRYGWDHRDFYRHDDRRFYHR